jgi:aminoglycoside phosphotransferase (APT) family kinase protein
MLALGIGTPQPFAAITADDGRAWYVCAWAEGCATLRQMSRDRGPAADRLCQEAGTFVGRMHQVGAYHFDSTPGNVLVRQEADRTVFLVVDCNRMRFGRVGAWAGIRSLVQLDGEERLLDSYCAARGWQPGSVRWMYRLRLRLDRWSRALGKATRPLRRKLGI